MNGLGIGGIGGIATLSDLSLAPVVTVEGRESLWDAWQLMFVSGMRNLAVVDSRGECRGVVTDRALLADLPLTEEHLADRTVADVMTDPGVVHAGDTAQQVARHMVDHAVDAVPLVGDDGRLRGLVTSADLVRLIAGH